MSKVRVSSFAISIDGYGAGPRQSRENPLGAGGLALHDWAFATRTFQRIHGQDGGATGIDDDFAARGFAVLLGSGERLFVDIDLVELGYRCTEHVATPGATHLILSRPEAGPVRR